jgi:hypothetical protein
MGAVLRGVECHHAYEEVPLEAAIVVVKPFVLERLNLRGRWAGGIAPPGPTPGCPSRYTSGPARVPADSVNSSRKHPVVHQCSQMSPEFTGGHLKL